MSIADEMVGPGTLWAAGELRWLDVEGFDIRWLGERTWIHCDHQLGSFSEHKNLSVKWPSVYLANLIWIVGH